MTGHGSGKDKSKSNPKFDPLHEYITASQVARQRLEAHTHGRGGPSTHYPPLGRKASKENVSSCANSTPASVKSSWLAAHEAIQRSSSLGTKATVPGGAMDDCDSIMSGSPTTCSASNTPRSSTCSSASGSEMILKVVLIGDSGVGKSNLVLRFTKNRYQANMLQTVGFEFSTKTLRVGEYRIKAQIWDTAGQERFQSLTAAYYRNAVGAMIVYDITNRSSFENVTRWLDQVHEHAHESLVMILVGNKCDLAHLPNTRQVSTLEAARFANAHSMEFLETSALDATNVVEAFKKIIVPVGRLLSPSSAPTSFEPLPKGWRRVLSRTRPGQYAYENQYTRERIAFAPKEPARPSQQSFRSGAPGLSESMLVTVTKESLQLQHQKAVLAQNQSTQCGHVCPSCVIL